LGGGTLDGYLPRDFHFAIRVRYPQIQKAFEDSAPIIVGLWFIPLGDFAQRRF
jgi:hypothetical protein